MNPKKAAGELNYESWVFLEVSSLIINVWMTINKEGIPSSSVPFMLYIFSHLVNIPAAEFCRDVNLLSVFIHGEVEVSVESLQFYVVPVLVIE